MQVVDKETAIRKIMEKIIGIVTTSNDTISVIVNGEEFSIIPTLFCKGKGYHAKGYREKDGKKFTVLAGSKARKNPTPSFTNPRYKQTWVELRKELVSKGILVDNGSEYISLLNHILLLRLPPLLVLFQLDGAMVKQIGNRASLLHLSEKNNRAEEKYDYEVLPKMFMPV